MSKIELDYAHARITVSSTEEGNFELEVWPKQGVSAYVVMDAGMVEDMFQAFQRTDAFINEHREAGEPLPDNVVSIGRKKSDA